MVFARWRARRANNDLIEQIHGEIVAAARRPALYAAFGVADSFDGRFEMTALHAGLAMRRIGAIPGMGADMAQDLADCVFRHFDDALREMGVGDVVMPKRMKKLAEAFYGRNKAYAEALEAASPDALALALARNVYVAASLDAAPQARGLAEAARQAADALRGQRDDDICAGRLAFPALAIPAGAPS